LAEKATDEFCRRFAAELSPPGGSAVGAEALAAPPLIERQEAVIEVRTGASADESAEPGPAGFGAEALEGVTAALEGLGERQVRTIEHALASAGRQAAIQAERDRFYREAGTVRDAVERGSATLAEGSEERFPRVGIAAAPVQACWLNGTIRADTHVSVLGDIAEHRAVERIDVARQIVRDSADVTIRSAATLRQSTGLSGKGVLIAVIDSEVQLDHPALDGRIVHRRNYTREPFGTPDGHGTAVAGLIGAASPGFEGMAPGAQIYNYKVLATQSALGSTDFEGALALQHALEDGVRVANCSWGSGPAGDGTGREARACDTAWRLGMVVVKSAGNAGPGPGTLTTPADAEGVLVVGATGADGKTMPDYSSRGPTANGRPRPHVVAPGGEFGAEFDGIQLGGGTGVMHDEVGTSFAAPHVTGMIALLIEREPRLAPDEIRDRVIATCKPLANLDANSQGAGLVEPASL
jgi:serine protease AprX